MRVGSTIILINGYCYQSYNWNMIRPLGNLQRVLDSLEAYQCDEVSIIRPIRAIDSLEKFQVDIETLKKVNSMTPLSFGGGLRSTEYIDLLHDLPIERLMFSTAFIKKEFNIIEYSRRLFGHQAIQCLLPFKYNNGEILIFLSEKNEFIPLEKLDFEFINQYANEVILYDTRNEGKNNYFDDRILDEIDIPNEKIILTGGIGNKCIKKIKKKKIASVLIDNKVLHKEYSIKGYKNG